MVERWRLTIFVVLVCSRRSGYVSWPREEGAGMVNRSKLKFALAFPGLAARLDPFPLYELRQSKFSVEADQHLRRNRQASCHPKRFERYQKSVRRLAARSDVGLRHYHDPQSLSQPANMAHENVWYSRPRTFGKGSRGWYVRKGGYSIHMCWSKARESEGRL